MPPRTDVTVSIPIACEIAGVSRQLRAVWIGRKLISGRTSGPCRLPEALELAAFARLVAVLGFDDARAAWPGVQARCRTVGARLDVVYDRRLKSASAATTDKQLARLVRHGHPVQVVALGEHLVGVKKALRTMAR